MMAISRVKFKPLVVIDRPKSLIREMSKKKKKQTKKNAE